MKTYTIGEVAERFKTTHRTLRFYGEKGLVAPKRLGAHRVYNEEDLARLQFAFDLVSFGFTVAEVRALLPSRDDAAKMREALKVQAERLESEKNAVLAQAYRLAGYQVAKGLT